MDKNLIFAVNELKKSIQYPLEYRIAKYLIENGYSSLGGGLNTGKSINVLLDEVDPSLSIMYTNRIYNCMRDIELTESTNHPHHISNVTSLDEDKLKYGMEKWNEGIDLTLKSISETFLNPDNLKKADTDNDRVIFTAIGQTIKNHPQPEFIK